MESGPEFVLRTLQWKHVNKSWQSWNQLPWRMGVYLYIIYLSNYTYSKYKSLQSVLQKKEKKMDLASSIVAGLMINSHRCTSQV